jgi:hypothetical protein
VKAKPNTDQFKLKKDPSEFLEGGAADVADKLEKAQTIVVQPVIETKVHREQKVFRLPLDLINILKREAYERSIKTGARVTETELVEQSLRMFFSR